MKTQNATQAKWMRRISSLMAAFMMTMSFAGQASARILFQDDLSHDINSEGITINANDGGDEDVTLQLGNDGTDATILFDDGTGDVTLTAPGGDFSFGTDNISAGGITGTGVIDFSSATSLTVPKGASNPLTCTVGDLFFNTTDGKTYMCTATDTWGMITGSTDANTLDTLDSLQFLRADANDTYGDGGIFTLTVGADDTLQVDGTTTANGLLDANGIVTLGDNGDTVIVDSSTWDISGAGVASGFTGLSTGGTVSLGDNTGTIAINSSDWDVSATGDMTGIGAITADGLITGTAGTALSGAAINLNDNSNFAVNVGTGTSTGTVSIGGGLNTVAINTTSWDISGAGVASGFTGLTSTGTIDFSGATRMALHQGAANPLTCTEGDMFYNTTSNITYVCTTTDTWSSIAGSTDANTLDTLDSLQFLRADASDTYGDGGALTLTFGADDTLQVDGTTTANGAFDANGVVTIGDNGDTVTIDSSVWDITGAGAASGFTTFDASGNITTSGGDFIIGTTGLTETTSAVDSGAFLIGTFDEFDNSASANVQDVLDDVDAAIGVRTYTEDNVLTDGQTIATSLDTLDLKWGDLASNLNGEGAALVGVEDAGTYFTATTVEGALQELGSTTGSNAANVDTLVYYPEYPDAVIFQDGTNNRGTLEALYDDTNDEHYYNWASNQGTTQDIDIRFRFPLPADFVATGDLTFNYRTGTITEADNDVEIYVYNATDETTGNPTLCASDVTNTSANTWTTGIIAAATINTGCTGGTVLNAGDIVEIAIKLYDNTGTADFSDVGYLKLDYTN